MSEFIFIAPEGWTTFHPEQLTLLSQPFEAVQSWAENGNLYDLSAIMRDAGLIQPNEYIIEGRAFNGEIFVARVGAE